MNTYILRTDLHQKLLAQKRIDPITGDAIQEGDEVVFCASCKSIFFKDTWEYLGEKHCNQSNTLNYIPSHSINLKLGDEIVYHQPFTVDYGEITLSSKMKGWIYKEHNTGKFHKYFFGEDDLDLKIIVASGLIFLFSGLYIAFENLLFIIPIILILIPYTLIKYTTIRKYKKTLNHTYKKITIKSFVIKLNGISVCSTYGIKEIFLPLKRIRAITLSNLGYSTRKIIFEYDEEKIVTMPINPQITKDNFDSLLEALGKMSQNLDFPITLYIDNKLQINKANQLIKEKNAKFTIENREECLKKKYGNLYTYIKKIQKLTS